MAGGEQGEITCREPLRLLAGRGQRLIACPLLDAALEISQRRRRSASWVPNDPYHLANAAAPTTDHRSPSGERRTLALSAATVTDHVRDSGHELTVSKPSLSRVKKAHSRWAWEAHGFASIPDRPEIGEGLPVGAPLIERGRFAGYRSFWYVGGGSMPDVHVVLTSGNLWACESTAIPARPTKHRRKPSRRVAGWRKTRTASG
jgi:hypothetical protein